MRLRRKKYKWKCKRCSFKIKTDDKLSFEISRDSHNHASKDEYKGANIRTDKGAW